MYISNEMVCCVWLMQTTSKSEVTFKDTLRSADKQLEEVSCGFGAVLEAKEQLTPKFNLQSTPSLYVRHSFGSLQASGLIVSTIRLYHFWNSIQHFSL